MPSIADSSRHLVNTTYYAEGDRLRDEIQAQRITLIDKPGGSTIWNRG